MERPNRTLIISVIVMTTTYSGLAWDCDSDVVSGLADVSDMAAAHKGPKWSAQVCHCFREAVPLRGKPSALLAIRQAVAHRQVRGLE